MDQKKLDQLAILWNKTKEPKYKELWYKEIKRRFYGKNFSDIDTFVRRNSHTRKV